MELAMVHSPTVHPHYIVVDLLVKQVASVVFQGIFDGNHSEDHQQGNHGDLLLKGFNNWHPVQQRQEQEVEVGSPAQGRPEQNINKQKSLKCRCYQIICHDVQPDQLASPANILFAFSHTSNVFLSVHNFGEIFKQLLDAFPYSFLHTFVEKTCGRQSTEG